MEFNFYLGTSFLNIAWVSAAGNLLDQVKHWFSILQLLQEASLKRKWKKKNPKSFHFSYSIL